MRWIAAFALLATPALADSAWVEPVAGGYEARIVTEATACTKGEPEELQLVRGRPGTVGKKFQALFPHLRVVLVREKLDAVVESANRRHEVVAKPRTKQAGEIERVHAPLNASEFNPAQVATIEP